MILFQEGSEEEVVRFDPRDVADTSLAQKTIHESRLSDEDKCFAHFWSGYFYAHVSMFGPDGPD